MIDEVKTRRAQCPLAMGVKIAGTGEIQELAL